MGRVGDQAGLAVTPRAAQAAQEQTVSVYQVLRQHRTVTAGLRLAPALRVQVARALFRTLSILGHLGLVEEVY